jgi:predicted nucleic acid-binding protein
VRSIVPDASIAIKWFLPEIHAEAARRLLGRGWRLLVPDLLYAEFTNILWKRVRRAEMSEAEAAAMLRALELMQLETHPSWTLAPLALEIACRLDRSAYDSLYTALAVREQAILVTADRKLYDALQSTPLTSHLCWVEDVDALS